MEYILIAIVGLVYWLWMAHIYRSKGAVLRPATCCKKCHTWYDAAAKLCPQCVLRTQIEAELRRQGKDGLRGVPWWLWVVVLPFCALGWWLGALRLHTAFWSLPWRN